MFILTFLYVLKDCARRPIKINLNLFIISILSFIITLLFFLTRYNYSTANVMYESELLCWGASSLPAFFCGFLYTKEDSDDIQKKLPFIIIPLTIIISYVSFTTTGRTSADRILDEATGMNYQSIAYYMAQLFGLTVFCILSEHNKERIYTNIILYIILIIQFITCFLSGGRGGLVVLLLYFIFFIYKKLKTQRINIISILGILLSIIILIFFIKKYNIVNSTGFSRLLETLHQGDLNRAILQAKALESFNEAPILGHGIGSIFFEIGTYSHNFIIDIMVETGIIGSIIIILFIIKCLFFLIKNKNCNSLFMTIIFIYAITLNTFSGYWLANHLLWFVFGYIISKNCHLIFSR